MILHRRIHKFITGKFDEGLTYAKEINRIAQEQLGSQSKVYITELWGGSLPRPRLIIDTEHENLAAMEKYYNDFFHLPELQKLIAAWQAIIDESWAENYTLIVD